LRPVVDDLITTWLSRHPDLDATYGLVVTHTHSHGDHVAGDSQFHYRPGTTIIPATKGVAWEYFGFWDFEERPSGIDLGARTIAALATPGHDAAAITFYDPRTAILFTGDTVYRGRLYIDDWPAFERTIDRLIEFSEANPVTHVLGCHIEMTTTPGVDYPVRTTFQPDEPPLEMTVDHLRAVRDALRIAGPDPHRMVCDDFILWPTP